MINRFVGAGRLTRITAFHVFQNSNGQPNPSMLFSIAVQRNFRNRKGQYDADFFDCRAEGHNAQYLHNFVNVGDTLIIDGEFHQTTYISHRFHDMKGNPARLHSFRLDVTNVQIAPSLKSLQGQNPHTMNPNMNGPRPPRSPRPPMNNSYPRPRQNRFPRRNFHRSLPPTSRPRNDYRNINPQPMRPTNNQQVNPMNRSTPNNQSSFNQKPLDMTGNTQKPTGSNQQQHKPNNSQSSNNGGHKININRDDLPF